MLKTLHPVRKFLLVGGVLLTLGLLALGLLLKACEYLPESSFELAKDSRLPKWITLPQSVTCDDALITMNYYILPRSSASFTLRHKKDSVLAKANGEPKCQPGFQLKDPPQGFPPGYPAYIPITVNGITEIIEHRKMESIFYVTDNPTVWKQYREFGCELA